MMGISYFKAEPTEYARFSVKGKTKKEGTGISGFFMPYKTSIELIGTTTIDQSFAFQEVSNDSQMITLQGGFLYKVIDPGKTMEMYNFAINPKSKSYMTDDTRKLPENILQMIRADTRRIVQDSPLENLLVMSDKLSQEVADGVIKSSLVSDLGLKIEMMYFTSIEPTPEIANALGTEYRESLLQKADKATYARRAMAVEQERAIKENEMTNKIELEHQREQFVELKGKNTLEEAQYGADAQKLEMSVFTDMNPETIRAHALYELGKNASRIETLTITPEILAGLK